MCENKTKTAALMKKTTNILTLFLLAFTLFSCNKNQTPANLICIPKDAQLVLCVDVDTLLAKAEIKDFKQSGIYTLLTQDLLSNHATLRQVLENPEKSGLAFKQVFGFVSAQGARALSFEMEDEDNFLELAKQVIQNEGLKSEIENASEYMILPLQPKDSSFLVWNEEKALLLTHCPKYLAIELIKTQQEASILTHPDFASFYKQRKEIGVWAKNESFYSLLSQQFDSPFMIFTAQAGAGTFSHVNLEFLAGKMQITNRLSPQDSVKSVNAQLFKAQCDQEFLKYIPAKPLFLAHSSLNKSLVEKQLEQTEALSEVLSPSQLQALQSWNGDLVAAVLSSNEYSLPQVVLGLSVSNQSISNTLLNELLAGYKQNKLKGYTAVKQQGFSIFVAQKGNSLMISNNELTMRSFVAGNAVAGSIANTNSVIKNSPAYLYMNLDMNSYPILIKSYLQSFGMNDQFNAALLLKEIELTYDEPTATSTYSISMKNNKANSLAVISNELGK